MPHKKYAVLGLIVGGLLLFSGALWPIVSLYLRVAEQGPIGIIGGADMPTYWFLYRAGLSAGWSRVLLAFGMATVSSAVLSLCCSRVIQDGVSRKTLLQAVALSALGALTLCCVECQRMMRLSEEWIDPIRYPGSLPLGMAAFVALLLMLVWYMHSRKQHNHRKGTLLELVIAGFYGPTFFFAVAHLFYLVYGH